MTVHLKPEVEKLIQKDLERGPYQSADEFVERAVHLLHEQEEWLAESRDEIRTKIEEGYASAQRGDLMDAESVRDEMREKKRAWRANRRPA
jgi:antitoxin ParD1/3/4